MQQCLIFCNPNPAKIDAGARNAKCKLGQCKCIGENAMQTMLIPYSLMEDVERKRLIRVLLTFCEMFFPDRYFPASSTSKEKEKEEKTSQ